MQIGKLTVKYDKFALYCRNLNAQELVIVASFKFIFIVNLNVPLLTNTSYPVEEKALIINKIIIQLLTYFRIGGERKD